jgi:hypothetical protein
MNENKERMSISDRNRKKGIIQKEYQEVVLFDVLMLFGNERVDSATLPDGIYCYELRGYDYDPGLPYAIEKKVIVNHAGTILTAIPLDLSEKGYLRLGEELNFTGGMASIQEYRDKMGSEELSVEIQKAENAIGRANEFLFFDGHADRYAIYQIDKETKAKAYIFMCWDFLVSHGMSVDSADYRYIYGGRLSERETLRNLFEKFNLNQPETYQGHSLSISDVVVIQRGKYAEAYYVDSIRYVPLPGFIERRKEYVRKLYERQDFMVNEDTTGLQIKQHEGTWHTVMGGKAMDEVFYLMEHDIGTPEQAGETADKPLTDLQKKAVEIAGQYENLPMRDKIGIIAQAFGGTEGKIETSPCTGKWRGTSDISIKFDNGVSLFIGNHRTPQAKTAKVQKEYVNSALVRYNPEIIAATKETAVAALRKREVIDNEIAAQKGLKPYILLNVEFNDGTDERSSGHLGWYYVTLAVDGKICSHIETGLNYDILDGKVSDTPARENYFVGGALKETDVDYVFNNVGFSSTSDLYSLPICDDVLERAEKALRTRI